MDKTQSWEDKFLQPNLLESNWDQKVSVIVSNEKCLFPKETLTFERQIKITGGTVIKKDQSKEGSRQRSVLSTTNPNMIQAPVKVLQLPFFLFLLYPCFPLKYLFLNSRVECSVNHPPSSALLTPSSYCCCFCSVAKSYLIFATPWTAARQAPLSLEFAETHVHWVCDAIQPSHPLSSPSLPAFSISQHQGLFQWVCCLHQVAEVLELPMNSHSWFPLGLTVWSPCSPRDSQESSPAPQFESISSSPFSLLYGPTLTSI